jgi:hypothetical protein
MANPDLMSKKWRAAAADLERALQRPKEWRDRLLTVTTKLVLQETAFEDWLLAEPDPTAAMRQAKHEELGIDSLKVEIGDCELLLRRAPEAIARMQRALNAVQKEEALAGLARCHALIEQICARALATPLNQQAPLLEELRPVAGLGAQWIAVIKEGDPLWTNREFSIPVLQVLGSVAGFVQFLLLPRLGAVPLATSATGR